MQFKGLFIGGDDFINAVENVAANPTEQARGECPAVKKHTNRPDI